MHTSSIIIWKNDAVASSGSGTEIHGFKSVKLYHLQRVVLMQSTASGQVCRNILGIFRYADCYQIEHRRWGTGNDEFSLLFWDIVKEMRKTNYLKTTARFSFLLGFLEVLSGIPPCPCAGAHTGTDAWAQTCRSHIGSSRPHTCPRASAPRGLWTVGRRDLWPLTVEVERSLLISNRDRQ